jgi:hypothetical protein
VSATRRCHAVPAGTRWTLNTAKPFLQSDAHFAVLMPHICLPPCSWRLQVRPKRLYRCERLHSLHPSILLLLLRLAVQPTVGFGLSNNILPFFPHLSPTLSIFVKSIQLFLLSTYVTISFLVCGVVSPTPNPQPGGPGYPFLSGSSPSTCLA